MAVRTSVVAIVWMTHRATNKMDTATLDVNQDSLMTTSVAKVNQRNANNFIVIKYRI